MTDKEKIIKYLDNKGVSKNKFYKKTGFSVGFLDSGSSLGVDKLRIIIDNYPDFNPSWLLSRGKEEMLLSGNKIEKPVSGVIGECQECEKLKEKISMLEQQLLESKNETIRAYQSNENNNNNKEESKGRNSA